MAQQSKLFDRAAECERLIILASDPVRQESFKLLRDMWIALANNYATMSADQLIKEVAAIEKMQSGFEQ